MSQNYKGNTAASSPLRVGLCRLPLTGLKGIECASFSATAGMYTATHPVDSTSHRNLDVSCGRRQSRHPAVARGSQPLGLAPPLQPDDVDRSPGPAWGRCSMDRAPDDCRRRKQLVVVGARSRTPTDFCQGKKHLEPSQHPAHTRPSTFSQPPFHLRAQFLELLRQLLARKRRCLVQPVGFCSSRDR
jgi:hypothetical protein